MSVNTSAESAAVSRLEPQPLPENIRGVQPGFGWGCRLELAWGRWRRRYLKRFRPGYVARMKDALIGDASGAPHEIIDARDLKYCRNVCDCRFRPDDDPFRWRERLPFARWGLAELIATSAPLLILIAVLLATPWPWMAVAPLVVLWWVGWFFRDPVRVVPSEPGLIVAPADGKVTDVSRIEHDEFIDGPAVKVGVFLSIFNVHINRAPADVRVIEMKYSRGEFLNALDPASVERNESMWIALEEKAWPHRRLIVRQIVGAIARRIVCDLKPGESVKRGHKFGMIKFGSRAELIVPATDDLEVLVTEGQKLRAGSDALFRYSKQARS